MATLGLVNQQKIFGRQELIFRLSHLSHARCSKHALVVTLTMLAKYMGLSRWRLTRLVSQKDPISDAMQLRLSQIFTMLDDGELIVKYEFKQHGPRRTIVRNHGDRVRPKRQPYVDFTDMRLKFT